MEAWEIATGHPDPLIAISAARAVRAHLDAWERELAREAVGTGATYEMVGEAMGVSRQAAWERFHQSASDPNSTARKRYERQVSRLRSEVNRLRTKADSDPPD
jgi:hypothetical protein